MGVVPAGFRRHGPHRERPRRTMARTISGGRPVALRDRIWAWGVGIVGVLFAVVLVLATLGGGWSGLLFGLFGIGPAFALALVALAGIIQ